MKRERVQQPDHPFPRKFYFSEPSLVRKGVNEAILVFDRKIPLQAAEQFFKIIQKALEIERKVVKKAYVYSPGLRPCFQVIQKYG
jgi:hypothetical protein